MKAIFIGNFYPQEREGEIRVDCKRGMDNAANALQWALLKGLDSFFSEITVFTAPAIQTFPFGYKKLFFKGSLFSHKEGSEDCCLDIINIPLIKHFVKAISLRRRLPKYENKEEYVIFIYSVHSPFLRAVNGFKKNKNIIICLIVPDLPQYMSSSSNWVYIFAKKIDRLLIDKYLKSVDCFVFLTEHMKEMMPCRNKPWTVLEGIYNPSSDSNLHEDIGYKTSECKIIFYSGTLEYRYGIMNLLDAFSKIDNLNYRLVICGEGDARKEVVSRSLNDDRVIYKGQQPRDVILKLQQDSDLLINPRTPEGEYTKYSFPSKTIEYLASGVPTLLYKLPGIPEEYYDFCFVIEKLGIDALSLKIQEILSLSKEQLRSKGLSAREFILSKKNPFVQTERIIQVITSCIKDKTKNLKYKVDKVV